MVNSISEDLRHAIRGRAIAEGFDLVHFTSPTATPHADAALKDFLALGRHGTMDWMARDPDRRAAPNALWPAAKSIIMLGANYGPSEDPLEKLQRRHSGTIASYALGDDYHEVLKGALKRIATYLHQKHGADVKVFIDTAPVMEKPLAQRAGLGWQGKHTNLVSRDYGSWLFLGSIFTDLDLTPDPPEQDHCGQCQRCLDICPTKAFPAPYQLDAKRCISYLTIEYKGHIDLEFREAMGNRIFGCDDCLAICPWNKFAISASHAHFHARETLRDPALDYLVQLDDAEFRTLFRKSPVKRTGRDRFIRNVLIAIGNAGDSNFAPLIEKLLPDPSPLVRAMAVWALHQIHPARANALRQQYLPQEQDEAVRQEWQRPISS